MHWIRNIIVCPALFSQLQIVLNNPSPGFNPRLSHTKMLLDAILLNTQHYKVRIKGEVKHLGVVAIEK